MLIKIIIIVCLIEIIKKTNNLIESNNNWKNTYLFNLNNNQNNNIFVGSNNNQNNNIFYITNNKKIYKY